MWQYASTFDDDCLVGWGKKETQFQGKAGKLAQQPKVPEAEVCHCLSLFVTPCQRSTCDQPLSLSSARLLRCRRMTTSPAWPGAVMASF